MSQNLKILAADDESLNLEIIEHSLRKCGHTVVCAYDGEQVLLLLNTEKFDLVLLDRMMPIINGIDVVRQIRINPKLKNIPIIMQTASSTRSQMNEGLEAGADHYLTKPYSKEVLIKIIEMAVNKQCIL